MSQEMQRDDALFEQLSKNKKRRRRRVLITVGVIVALVAVVLVFTVIRLRSHVQQTYGLSGTDARSAQVVTGTLSTVVSGKGILAEDELEAITVPEGVEITEVLVEAHQTVTQGQQLATVDASSVLTAMAALQESMKDLDKQIQAARDDKVSASLTTGVAGRVKLVYGQPDMTVTQCMAEHGALAVLSLDGFMAVEIPAGDLAIGDTVTVTREDGSTLEGTVDAVLREQATVLVTDDGPRYNETVTVSRGETALGSGSLYIHEPLAVTGYAGTIQSVVTAENRWVYRGSTLFYLTDTATSHTYDSLLRQRGEQEETLLELLQMQRTGAVTAPFSGSVYTVDHDENLAPLAVVTLTPDEELVITLNVDESDILSLSLDQTAEVTISSLSEDPWLGTVTKIDRTSVSSGVYAAQVTLVKEPGMLAGMTASVSIRIVGVENALLIPVEALHQTRTGAYVYTTYDPETETFGGETPVTVGIQGTDQVEILEGLSQGDTVWYVEEFNIFDFFSGGGAGRNPGGNPGGNRG